ncbi:MAG: hypothetical protein HYX75_08875 [Acidobacteria bacterium]|nr:hypothetical protein [Acidobacteriota bacterium]
MKAEHKLFFAIPFDSATKNLYDCVTAAIKKRYPHVTTVIGKEEVGPSPEYSEIASFKAQNRELSDQFVDQIRDADIVVADLTHNNPNVHVELGLALGQNKNILRVTGRSVSELGFDIRNLEAFQYKDQSQLIEKIARYLDTFLRIKQLEFSTNLAALHAKEPSKIELRAFPPNKEFDTRSNVSPNFRMRDGAVRVEFEILQARHPHDWFGVFIRAGYYPWQDSNLVYIRQDGRLEVVPYPGASILGATAGQPTSGRQTLNIEFENNYLLAEVGQTRLEISTLSSQGFGRVLPAVFGVDADVHAMQLVCRDTIDR